MTTSSIPHNTSDVGIQTDAPQKTVFLDPQLNAYMTSTCSDCVGAFKQYRQLVVQGAEAGLAVEQRRLSQTFNEIIKLERERFQIKTDELEYKVHNLLHDYDTKIAVRVIELSKKVERLEHLMANKTSGSEEGISASQESLTIRHLQLDNEMLRARVASLRMKMSAASSTVRPSPRLFHQPTASSPGPIALFASRALPRPPSTFNLVEGGPDSPFPSTPISPAEGLTAASTTLSTTSKTTILRHPSVSRLSELVDNDTPLPTTPFSPDGLTPSISKNSKKSSWTTPFPQHPNNTSTTPKS